MIELFEKRLEDYFKLAIPELKQIAYAENDDLFEAFNKKKLTPSLYFKQIVTGKQFYHV